MAPSFLLGSSWKGGVTHGGEVRIVASVARVLFVALLLFLGTSVLKDRYHGSFAAPDEYVYAKGSAPEDVRGAVIERLRAFQRGYVERDPEQLEPFMAELFSKDNILILGTMPREVFLDLEQATDLVGSDWEAWGDCRFSIDNAHVSSQGDVAWFSTVGYVEFDLSSLLVVPLRLTGVLAREEGEWRFQHLQFQFDVDFSFLLLLNLLLAGWLLVSIVSLGVGITRRARARQATAP